MNLKIRVPRIPPDNLGYAYVTAAAVLWAASGSASKYLFHGGVSPFQLVQLRTTLATAALFFWLLIRKPSFLKITRHDLIYFSGLGFGLAAAQFTYLYAISQIQVAAAILLQYQSPVIIAIYGAAFSHERLRLLTFAAIFGAVAGCYLVAGAYSFNLLSMNRAGILAGLSSAVAFAWYSIRSESGMRKYTAWTVVFFALLFAAIIWNILHPPFAAFAQTYRPEQWAWILFIGTLGTILPFGFYNKGIELIRSACASITATLEPIAAGIFSFIFLAEIMEPWQIMGAALVIFSIILLQIRKDPSCQPKRV